jgi:hypothetical protein
MKPLKKRLCRLKDDLSHCGPTTRTPRKTTVFVKHRRDPVHTFGRPAPLAFVYVSPVQCILSGRTARPYLVSFDNKSRTGRDCLSFTRPSPQSGRLSLARGLTGRAVSQQDDQSQLFNAIIWTFVKSYRARSQSSSAGGSPRSNVNWASHWRRTM